MTASNKSALMALKRMWDESLTSSSRSTTSTSRPVTCDTSPARGLPKVPWAAPVITSTSTSFMLSHPLTARPPPTSFPPGFSRASLPMQPHTPTSLTGSVSMVTGAWRPRLSATTTTTLGSSNYRPSSVSCRPRSIPAPSRSMPATTASLMPTLESALLRYKPWGQPTIAGSMSALLTHITASLAVGGQPPNRRVMSPALRSSQWPDEAWVRRGANQSPDADTLTLISSPSPLLSHPYPF